MNFAHLHLLLNHFPIVGSIIGLGLFLISCVRKQTAETRRMSLIVFAAIALLTIPAFLTGFSASALMKEKSGVSEVLIARHQGSAMLSLWFMLATGAFALVGLWQMRGAPNQKRWSAGAVLLFGLLTVGLMARTGNTGGDIRHPEVWTTSNPATNEGPVGSIIRIFEPSPERFQEAMVSNKWWWWILMALHFVGLALIIGAVGALDLRILGFAKQIPIKPLHEFVPWALAGLGINILTGLLAFIGQSDNYITSEGFWLKMVALLLLGLNGAVFYLTNIFEGIERVGSGEDASVPAKLTAASMLLLCFAILALGRYIQPLSNTMNT